MAPPSRRQCRGRALTLGTGRSRYQGREQVHRKDDEVDCALEYGRATGAQRERRDDQRKEQQDGAFGVPPSEIGRLTMSERATPAGIVNPMVAKAEPRPKLRLVWRRSANAARSAATLSGRSTKAAMMTPTMALGAPAAATAPSIVGARLLANNTTAPRQAISSTAEVMVAHCWVPLWISSSPTRALSGRNGRGGGRAGQR